MLPPGARLGSYQVVAAIGAGGMGEVYRATDTKLGRDVALKVLPAEVASDPDRLARFQREAKALAALDHPGIVTVFTVEEAEGVHFLTMQLVEGKPLDKLIPSGGMPVQRLLDIARSLAEALAAAHEKGVVHRDLKPGNVMVGDDGRVKVLDFGLAKFAEPEPSAAATVTHALTGDGIVMGTVPYMSPEQVAGRPVDQRTDVFAFGVILYEMAAGRRPFAGTSSAEIASAILRDAPLPIATLRPDLPAALQRTIESCLGKDPDARPRSARELRLTPPSSSGPVATPDAAERSIAVLPLASLSSHQDDEFFADGVTEEILNALAQIPGLRVPGRSSAFSFKGRNEDVRAVGAKLGVGAVLEGTLRRAGNRLRITVRLTDAGSGYQLWSERYDRIIDDVFAVQDEIAATIAGRLRLSLAAGRATAGAQPPTRHIGAYELYLKGRALLYRRGPSILRAIECFQRAVALDPDYAQAWAGLADGFTNLGTGGLRPGDEVMPRAVEAARRALALDPGVAEAHTALACASMLYERDFALAEREFRRALELNPTYAQGHAWYALWYLEWISGREGEAHRELVRAVGRDPLSAYAHTILGFACFTSGRHHEAVQHARRGAELDPDSYLAQWCFSESLRLAGHLAEAEATVQTALAMSARHAWALSTLAGIHAAAGQPSRALAVHRELEDRCRSEHVPPAMLVATAVFVGDFDRAVLFAEQALRQRDPLFVLLARRWPAFEPLRRDPRFLAIVGELHLPDWEAPA